jgi:hypothetical protein
MIGPTHINEKASAYYENAFKYTVELAKFYCKNLGNITAGSLHIVLSDGNIEREYIDFCLKFAKERRDWVGVALAKCLLELKPEDVEKIYKELGRQHV